MNNGEREEELKKEMDDLDSLEDEIESQDREINSNLDEFLAMAAKEQDDEMIRMANDLQERMTELRLLTFKKLSLIRDNLEDEKKRVMECR